MAARDGKASSYTAALYGSIAVAALVGALRHTESAQKLTVTVAGTIAAFWLAKAWSAMVGERLERRDVGARDMLRLLRGEWPMVESGAVPVAALALAWAGAYSVDTGVKLALAIAILQLVAWGFVGGLRSEARWPLALLSGAIDGAIGVGIVLLEVAVH